MSSCGLLGAAPPGESTGDNDARSTQSNGKLASIEPATEENAKEEPSVRQKIEVEQKAQASAVLLSFVGEAKRCVPIDATLPRGGGMLIVGNDPRYLLTVAIVKAPKEDPRMRAGAEMTLGIHSPSLLFGDDWKDAVGKRFKFRLHGTLKDGQRKFFHVDSEEIEPGKELTSSGIAASLTTRQTNAPTEIAPLI